MKKNCGSALSFWRIGSQRKRDSFECSDRNQIGVAENTRQDRRRESPQQVCGFARTRQPGNGIPENLFKAAAAKTGEAKQTKEIFMNEKKPARNQVESLEYILEKEMNHPLFDREIVNGIMDGDFSLAEKIGGDSADISEIAAVCLIALGRKL